jgi:hypothetical protein
MDLADQQRKLFRLIKDTYQATEDDEPYIRTVARSEQLSLVQEIVQWWRSYSLEQFCPLTSTLLKRQDRFEETVLSLIHRGRISPFIETLGTTFLAEMSTHEDAFVAAVAQFELALIKVKQGSEETFFVDWPYEPYTVLNSLLTNLPFEKEVARGSFRTVISTELPRYFEVLAVQS